MTILKELKLLYSKNAKKNVKICNGLGSIYIIVSKDEYL